jgi:hypothetical protein
LNLDGIDGDFNEGLDRSAISRGAALLVDQLPAEYLQLLELANGVNLASGCVVYAAEDLVERNETIEMAKYLPDCVAIGDDSGGTALVLHKGRASPVMKIAMGALGSVQPVEIAADIEHWVECGFAVETGADQDAQHMAFFADLFLDTVPGGKLTSLITIKKELGLEISIAELKALAQNLPARIAKNVPSGKYGVRCAALNSKLGQCVSLRM